MLQKWFKILTTFFLYTAQHSCKSKLIKSFKQTACNQKSTNYTPRFPILFETCNIQTKPPYILKVLKIAFTRKQKSTRKTKLPNSLNTSSQTLQS